MSSTESGRHTPRPAQCLPPAEVATVQPPPPRAATRPLNVEKMDDGKVDYTMGYPLHIRRPVDGV